jgi:hypothetical protein
MMAAKIATEITDGKKMNREKNHKRLTDRS